MNTRETRRFLKEKVDKSGSYRQLAEDLSTVSGINITWQAVYQWKIRGVIPARWRIRLGAI